MSLLEVRNVKKVYTTRLGANQVQALSNVNFSVEDGEYVAIMGESGSGKTTMVLESLVPALEALCYDKRMPDHIQRHRDDKSCIQRKTENDLSHTHQLS